LLGNRKRIVNLNAEVSDRALDFGVSEQQLNRSQIAGSGPTVPHS